MRKALALGCVVAATLAAYAPARAEPIVYTGYGVADGTIGSWTFTQAQVTLQFRGDTRNTYTAPELGGNAYRNDVGFATIVITQGTTSVAAHLAPHQVYVRYNPTLGSAGFGSFAVGPLYPIVFSCFGAGTCDPTLTVANGDFPAGEILPALSHVLYSPGDAAYYSPALSDLLTADLRGPALLSGYVLACANYDSNNGVCPGAPSQPIVTDQGNLFFATQDASGKGFLNIMIGRESD
jgi:hypothetical protein